LVVEYAYSAYGEAQTLGPDEGNPLQYTGRENDGTGLYYYRARYYDPVLKRFISEDPIGIEGSINPYTYVNGNPLSYSDPEGLLGRGGQPNRSSGGYPAKQLPPPNNPYPGYNWCGEGANVSLPPTNCVDAACQKHDRCYQECGVRAGTRWFPNTLSICATRCDWQLIQDYMACKSGNCLPNSSTWTGAP